MALRDSLETVRRVVQAEAQAVRRLADQLDEQILPVLDLLSMCSGHVLVTGAGTSHAMAQRLAHLMCCCGTPALAIDAGDGLHGGSGAITSRDVLYVISKGGRSVEVNQLAGIAKARGAKVIAQTENPDSPLAAICDAVLIVRAPPDIDPHGMIALGSSLVNGAAGDALCAALLQINRYGVEDFGTTHPRGAVGQRLSERSAGQEDESR
jgi:arabinose-5-phosphate isomerase